jgi:replicative DNA helicase
MKNADKDTPYLLTHDLAKAAVNLKGFATEIDLAVISIVELSGDWNDRLPSDFIEQLHEILDGDMQPCLSMLQASCKNLDSQIDRIGELIRAANR